MRQCKREGCRVILLTSKSLQDAGWSKEYIDEIFYIPDVDKQWNLNDVIYGVSYMARTVHFDKIVALDDYDVEKAAALREHLRIAGMGETAARFFRDKLAMRARAAQTDIPVPQFIQILNYDKLRDFLKRVEPPYILKPRLQAGAIGIRKIHSEQELWDTIETIGDEQSFYLLEKFLPGEIFHVDAITLGGKVLFSMVSKYGTPPMEVAHQGRVFSSHTEIRGSDDEKALQGLNQKVLVSFGLGQGVSHTEFIKDPANGEFYFLETSARVGGAHIVELVEAASGLNLWTEWARIEVREQKYTLPEYRKDYAGLMISLAKQEWPDLSAYHDPEVVWKLSKKYHAGLIIASPNYDRVEELLRQYTQRFYQDFFTTQPFPDKPTD